MNTGIKISVAVLAVVLLLLIAFLGYRFVCRGLLRKDEGPVLKIPKDQNATNIIFLHHSTGRNIWMGGVEDRFKEYNREHGTNYNIVEQSFPKRSEYGWRNYPYDYWNIWVNNSGHGPYKAEPTLEMITEHYDVVVFKHCFPVSNILPDTGNPDMSSDEKRMENYILQYNALKEKMYQFPDTRFIVWTGAALEKDSTEEDKAVRARSFFDWVRNEWNEEGDNIFIWDFYELETEGGLYLKTEYAEGPGNSHPNMEFSKRVAPLLCNSVIDAIEKG